MFGWLLGRQVGKQKNMFTVRKHDQTDLFSVIKHNLKYLFTVLVNETDQPIS